MCVRFLQIGRVGMNRIESRGWMARGRPKAGQRPGGGRPEAGRRPAKGRAVKSGPEAGGTEPEELERPIPQVGKFREHRGTNCEWQKFLRVDECLCTKQVFWCGRFEEFYRPVSPIYFSWIVSASKNEVVG